MKNITKKQGKITRKNVNTHLTSALAKKDYALALNLIYRCKPHGYTVVLSTLKQKYKLSKQLLSQLECLEVSNPHYKTAAPMKLFFIAQIEDLITQKNNNA